MVIAVCRGSSCQHRAAGMQQPGTQSSTQRHLQPLQLPHLTLIISPRLSRTLSGKPVFLPVSRQGGFYGLGCHLPQEEQKSVIPTLTAPVLGPAHTRDRAELLGARHFESACLSMTESRMCEGCAGSGSAAVSLMLTPKSSPESESLEITWKRPVRSSSPALPCSPLKHVPKYHIYTF